VDPPGPPVLHFEFDEEAYLTIALEPDTTLKKQWRLEYFLCKPDALSLLDGSNLPETSRMRWESLLSGVESESARNVLASLATWTITRLINYTRVYIWADRSFGWYPDYRETALHEIEEALGSTIGASRWRRHLDADCASHATLLDCSDEEFLPIIAAYILTSSLHSNEFNFMVEDGSEVYKMHHHDKVIVLIPDAEAREALIEELCVRPSLFEDFSCYYRPDEERAWPETGPGDDPAEHGLPESGPSDGR